MERSVRTSTPPVGAPRARGLAAWAGLALTLAATPAFAADLVRTATVATATLATPRRMTRPAGPVLELPAGEEVQGAAADAARGASEAGLGRRSTLGGYGEGHLTFLGDEAEANLKRFVLFVGHRFNDWAAVYTETEVEDAHELELEQAYVELTPSRRLGVRAGLIIVPLGLTNLHHEPPTFHGVARPLVDQQVLPSTWRELGAGVFGELTEGLRYQVYLVSGLRGDRLDAEGGFRGARGLGLEAPAKEAAAAARLSWEPTLGLELSLAGYFGGAGQGVDALDGVKLGVVEADVRYRRRGLELQAQAAASFTRGADLVTAYRRLAEPTALAVPSASYGLYVEAAYDVLFGRAEQALLPFVRFERLDLRAARPDVQNPGEGAPQNVLFLGLSYRPIPQLVFKADYRLSLGEGAEEAAAASGEEAEAGHTESGLSLGVGFMF